MSAFTIVSAVNETASNIDQLFNFLSDFKNFKNILPEDKVENFQFNDNSCSFSIKGVTPMSIRMVQKKPYEFILFETDGLAKFNFSLKAMFEGAPDGKGTCHIDLTGDLNSFIQTMVEKQLHNLVNTMSLKLSKLQLNRDAN